MASSRAERAPKAGRSIGARAGFGALGTRWPKLTTGRAGGAGRAGAGAGAGVGSGAAATGAAGSGAGLAAAGARAAGLAGAAATVPFYIVFNVGMVIGLLPVVGMPLPLISYGGTAMLTTMACFGLILSAHMHRDEKLSSTGII